MLEIRCLAAGCAALVSSACRRRWARSTGLPQMEGARPSDAFHRIARTNAARRWSGLLLLMVSLMAPPAFAHRTAGRSPAIHAVRTAGAARRARLAPVRLGHAQPYWTARDAGTVDGSHRARRIAARARSSQPMAPADENRLTALGPSCRLKARRAASVARPWLSHGRAQPVQVAWDDGMQRLRSVSEAQWRPRSSPPMPGLLQSVALVNPAPILPAPAAAPRASSFMAAAIEPRPAALARRRRDASPSMLSPEEPYDGGPTERVMEAASQELMNFQGLSRVAVADPTVADVVVISTHQLLIHALKPGRTTLFVWDRFGTHRYDVKVLPVQDNGAMEKLVRDIGASINRPDVTVSQVNGTVFLEGAVNSDTEKTRAAAIAGAYGVTTDKIQNLLTVVPAQPPIELMAQQLQSALGDDVQVRPGAGSVITVEGSVKPQEKARIEAVLAAWPKSDLIIADRVTVIAGPRRQVSIQARIIDLDNTASRDLGIDWEPEGHGQPFQLGRVLRFAGTPGGNSRDAITAALSALIASGKARMLSEPYLTVLDNETAHIQVGGQIPVPSATASGGSTTTSIIYQPYGIQLDVTPTLSDDGKSMKLAVSPQVSSLDYTNAITTGLATIPALLTRSAKTTLDVNDGETVVIGGLISHNQTRDVRRIPFLSNIPILGQLFRSTKFTQGESELLILVTPVVNGTVPTSAAPMFEKEQGEPVPTPGEYKR